MKKLNWGIISTGTIARIFAGDFANVTGGNLMAVASRTVENAQQFASEFKISKAYGSYEALYKDEEIDAIYVATPHNFHLQNSMDALRAGKAVLCEKPLTVNLQEGKELTDFARNSGSYLMEAMWTYFLPAIQKAQEWVAAGKIGPIKMINADFGYPKPFEPEGRMYNPDLAGGVLLDMGIYPIAMAWLFLKKDPQEIYVVNRNAPTGVDHEVSMIFEYEDEVANLTTSCRAKLHNELLIIGTEGYIRVPDFWRASECFLYEGEKVKEHFDDGRPGHGFSFEIDAVNEDVLAGRKENQIMTHETSKKLLQLMDSVRERFHN